MSGKLIYHICKHLKWREAQKNGKYLGSLQDEVDGFIHFSGVDQIRESAIKYYSKEPGLVLLCVDSSDLGALLKWEPSSNGILFPHLYGPLYIRYVLRVKKLLLDENGIHIFSRNVLNQAIVRK